MVITKMYGISGLGADKRVFQYLSLDCELVSIDWIDPLKNESLQDYALRLENQIDTSQKFGIIGVSFGGLVAVELSKKLNPNLTVLISSVETKGELRTIYRLVSKTKINQLIPKQLYNPPRFIANWLFGAKDKILLDQILSDTDLKFAKWSVNALLNWKNKTKLTNPVLKISGNKDKLIPPASLTKIRIIDGGQHFMIVDRAKEIETIINQEIKKLDSPLS